MIGRRHPFGHSAQFSVLTWLGVLCLGLASVPAAQADGVSPGTNHWSMEPVRRPAVPAGGNPIDAFVGAALRREGLKPNPPAAPIDLVRRLYFDLIGLPPSPAEIDAFVSDPAPDRYERLVDRLLMSPRYGERWARHWLDVVRYTESQGFEYDRLRDHAWHYRDYVIRSFNEDKRYDVFMREQIAGDVLEPGTREGVVAAGLLVAGPWDQAGNVQANATQRAITREEEMEDLVSVVGQTFLGLTVNCARCHDHKFDPIPLVDYYRVKAVFDGVKHGDRSIESESEKTARESRLVQAREEVTRWEKVVSTLEQAGASRVMARKSDVPREAGPMAYERWAFDGVRGAVPSGEAKGGAVVGATGLQLPKAGAYFEAAPLTRDIREKTLEAWVSLSDLEQGGGAAISLESRDGATFDAIVFGERQGRKWMAGSEGFVRTKDVDGPVENDSGSNRWVHVVLVHGSDNRVTLYRNGEPYGASYVAAAPIRTFQAGEARIVLGRRHQGGSRTWLTGSIRQAALYDRALTPAEVGAAFRSGGFAVSKEEGVAALNEGEKRERDEALKRLAQARGIVVVESKSGPVGYVGTRVQPEPTRALTRGDVKSPGDVVTPGGLGAIRTVSADFGLRADAPEAQRRLKFSEWLANPANPLPARVLVNRVWHFHFGQGLVATPSDFGRSGAAPSHPELIDWLASEFVAQGWSIKALHRWIVTSVTYRQSSDSRPDAVSVDADNRWLWRFPPRRLEAEAVRDAMLAASGNLNLQLGGPSFRPFTTSEYGAMFYHLFDKGDPEFNRRTVYRMNINSGKEPLLDAFDCPDPSVKTPRRGVTTTPLQALGLMNGSFVQRQASGLAERAQKMSGGDVDRAVDAAYRLALGRPAKASELRQAGAAARERGLPHVCWALLNSTEFVYVR